MKEYTAKRIEGAKATLTKLTAKRERVKVALSSGKNPYYYDESDIGRTEREIAAAVEALKGWEAKGAKEDAEDGEAKVPAVEQFLEEWKQKAINYYTKQLADYRRYIAGVRAKQEEIQQSGKRGAELTEAYKAAEVDRESRQRHVKCNFTSLAVELLSYGSGWEKRLETIVENEKRSKRIQLIARVEKEAGKITDASGLYVGDNGEINGLIVGEKAPVRVTTITAGGYNIQCFHFRVLVKKQEG